MWTFDSASNDVLLLVTQWSATQRSSFTLDKVLELISATVEQQRAADEAQQRSFQESCLRLDLARLPIDRH